MKYFSIIIILLIAACGRSKNAASNDTANSTVVNKNTIQVKVNEEKTIQLPGFASSNPQMVFTLTDTSIAEITRKQMVSTYDSTGLRPGDPVLAFWVVKGLKPGTTRLKFAGADVSRRRFKIVVTE